MKVLIKIVEGLIGSKLGGGIQLHWTEEYLPLTLWQQRIRSGLVVPTRNVLPGHHLPGLQSLCSPGYQCGVGAVADFPVIFIFPGVCGDSRCKRSQGGVGQVGVGTRMWCGNLGWSGSGQLGDSGCTRVVWEVIRVEWIASGLSRGFMVIPLHMGCGVVLGQPPFGRGAAPATYRLPPVPGVLQSGQVAVMNMSCVRSV